MYKIIISYMVTVGFFALGRYLESKDKYISAARGIQAGAWGLLYLSTYAMHYFNETRLIYNPAVEITLLLIVSIAAVIYHLRYNSWGATAFSYILFFITLSLGGVKPITPVLCGLIAVSIVYISIRKQWHEFLAFGVTGTFLTAYATIFYSIYHLFPKISFTLQTLTIDLEVLAVLWLTFIAGTVFMNSDDKNKELSAISTILLNSAFYGAFVLYELYRAKMTFNADSVIKTWLFLGPGIISFAVAYILKKMKKENMIPINVCIGFSLIATAAVISFESLNVSLFLLAEMTVIAIVGIIYKSGFYRKFSWYFTSLVFIRMLFFDIFENSIYNILNTIQLKHNVIILLFAAICFFIIRTVMKRKSIDEDVVLYEHGINEASLYLFASFSFIASLIYFNFNKDSISFMLLLEMLVIFIAGVMIKDKAFRQFTWFLNAVIFLRLIFVDLASQSYYDISGSAVKNNALIFLSAAICMFIITRFLNKEEPARITNTSETDIYSVAMLSFVAIAISLGIRESLISLFLLIEMIVVIALGIIKSEKIYRIFSAIFGMLIFLRIIYTDYQATALYFNTVYQYAIVMASAAMCYYAISLITLNKGIVKKLANDEQVVYPYFSIFSVILISLLLYKAVPNSWLTISFALEGITFLVLGFLLTKKIDRISGLALLVLASFRIFLIDISGLDIIYKVIAFTILGGILLAASLVYSKYMSKNRID